MGAVSWFGVEKWVTRRLDKSYLPHQASRLGSPLAACSTYGDLTCSVHTVNNFHRFVIIKRMYIFVSEDHMLDWHSCQICYPLEIKLLLTDGGR